MMLWEVPYLVHARVHEFTGRDQPAERLLRAGVADVAPVAERVPRERDELLAPGGVFVPLYPVLHCHLGRWCCAHEGVVGTWRSRGEWVEMGRGWASVS